jgi:hypothetical protein
VGRRSVLGRKPGKRGGKPGPVRNFGGRRSGGAQQKPLPAAALDVRGEYDDALYADPSAFLRLWGAVLVMAARDAFGHRKAKNGEYARSADANRREARAWFERAGRDFRLVCAWAETDQERTAAWAAERIREGE